MTAEHNHQHIFTSQCLKRKLETSGRNGFTAVEENVMCAGEQDCNLISEKRPRFSDYFAHNQEQPVTEIHREEVTNGFNYFPNVSSADVCSSVDRNGNNTEADSVLQNNLQWNASSEIEEPTVMDFDFETDGMDGCPPNLNVVNQSTPCSSTENSPAKGSPAREFLQKHRPEYQMHCIPSYCHPGGLWDVMLEVYHGL